MQSSCHDDKQMSDWQDKGHNIKIALLAKAVCNPAPMLPVLTLPGSPGTCTALPLSARQGLPGTSLLHHSGGSWKKSTDTSKMLIWKAKCEHSFYHVHKFESAARLKPSFSHLSSLQRHYPLLVLKLSFRPLPGVLNGVVYSSCRLPPTEPHETEKK